SSNSVFFQAEDGIRYRTVTGVQTCALPIFIGILAGSGHLDAGERDLFLHCARSYSGLADLAVPAWLLCASRVAIGGRIALVVPRSEERRVGKECSARQWSDR